MEIVQLHNVSAIQPLLPSFTAACSHASSRLSRTTASISSLHPARFRPFSTGTRGIFSKPREDHIFLLLNILQWLPTARVKMPHSPWPRPPPQPALTTPAPAHPAATDPFSPPRASTHTSPPLMLSAAHSLLHGWLLLILRVPAKMTPPQVPSLTTPPHPVSLGAVATA